MQNIFAITIKVYLSLYHQSNNAMGKLNKNGTDKNNRSTLNRKKNK